MKKNQTFLSSNQAEQINEVLWIPESTSQPKAILQIVHGMAEYIERYQEFAEHLNQYNILVVGHDHLGHGQSVDPTNPKYGYFNQTNSVSHLIEDVYQVTKRTKAAYPNTPYFIMGHSMGSFITRNYLKKYSKQVDGAIIMGTGGKEIGATLIRPLTTVLNKFAPEKINNAIDKMAFGPFGQKFPEHPKPMCWLSLNQTNVDNYLADPLLGKVFTNNGFHTLFQLSSQANKKNWFKTIRKDLPILIISGEDDPVGQYGKGPTTIAADLTNNKFKSVNLLLYPTLRHEILNEENSHMIMRDITNWLTDKL
ncbi:alpha/beta hydrolase [Vagococcus coleopterorum]|uniref:Alpha/beta hydrolase n=1 Tax=Vagococcus coleopterorum TaxID=2714946 RepID=A0A6G8ANJ2_9ENTE|nr:alpha/beta fold hydrolase [Vagococcus coleopterorum]QIL46539.1 alpha/beta hydrolase [Vagococcus coleopterorum]